MTGVANLTQEVRERSRPAKSAITTENHSMITMAKSGEMHSRQGHQTRTTEYTSNIGNITMHDGTTAFDRATSAAGGGLSFAPGPGSATPTVAGGDGQTIINYPFAYDQDQKHEVDFAERLYRANHEVQRVSQELYTSSIEIEQNAEQRQNVAYPTAAKQAGLIVG